MTFLERLHYLTRWRYWDYRVKLVPLAPVWVWHGLRARSPWFFTAANPTLTFGGFQGETKQEMYAQLPPGTYPKSLFIPPNTPLANVAAQLEAAGLTYPLAAKPDDGMMGLLFRKLDTPADLAHYVARVPVPFLVQPYVAWPLEVSVFYYRFPGEERGRITGFVRKDFLTVTGDGYRTLAQLVADDERTTSRQAELRARHLTRWTEILPANERYVLSQALNQTRGGQLVSLHDQIDTSLLAIFDQLSHYTDWYFGRYDLKCSSIEALKAGEFQILEFNGAGAAPHHVYAGRRSLWDAWRIVLHHWAALARIARLNRQRGVKRWPLRRGWAFLRRAEQHLNVLKALEKEV